MTERGKADKAQAAARVKAGPRAARTQQAPSAQVVVVAAASRPKRGGRSAAPAVRLYAPGPPIDGEAALAAALAKLRAIDPQTIDHLVEVGGAPPLRLREPGFEGLVAIVLSQQVSTASAAAIGARLRAHIDPLTPAGVASAGDEVLRAAGLSGPKMRTLRALSEAIASGSLALEALATMEPSVAHDALVAVKGIGPWTADIFLLFCLGHPDAWPAGDLALQEAARLALKLERRPDTRALEAIGERWRPHRGVAARLLWAYYRAAKGREGVVVPTSAG